MDIRTAINLVESQQLIELASANMDWFAGSKVVDKTGAPAPMFHGGNQDITQFRPLTHFGTKVAANQRIKNTKRHDGAVVYPVYLRITNPLKVTDAEASDEATLLRGIVTGKYPNIDGGLARKEGVVAACEDAGYDGFVYQNNMEDRGRLSWVIFRPDQVRFVASSGE